MDASGIQEISQFIPDCAKPCLDLTFENATCSPDDFDCLCGLAWNSPVFNGCSMVSCNISQGLATINGTATACNIPVSPQSPALYLATIIFGVVAIICILIRLLWHPKSKSEWLQRADDWMMVCNAVFVVGMIGCTIAAHNNGNGKDIWTIPTRQIRTIMILIYSLELQYTAIIHLSKLSILYFYLQFFPFTVFPKVRTAIYVTMAATMASGISFMMAITFQCTPIDSFWNAFNDDYPPAKLEASHCFNITAYGFIGASINLAFDVWLMALPMPELFKLSLPLRKKIVVCLMFAVGGFVTAITTPRILYMNHFKHTTNPIHDLLWVSFWAHIECLSSVILACTPSVCIALVRLYRKRRASQMSPLGDGSPPARMANNRVPIGGSAISSQSARSAVADSETTYIDELYVEELESKSHCSSWTRVLGKKRTEDGWR